MPIGKYFQGHGSDVMSDMQDRYGEKKGKSVFYATANKRNQNPEDNRKPKPSPSKRKSIGQMIAEG